MGWARGHAASMPVMLLVLLPLLAGCVLNLPDPNTSTTEVPFTLTALDVGHPKFRFRCQVGRVTS